MVSEQATASGTHLVNVRVYQRNVVVAGDAVAQRVEPLVYALHHQLVWQAIPDVHHLCRRKPRSVNTYTANALGHASRTYSTNVPWSVVVFGNSRPFLLPAHKHAIVEKAQCQQQAEQGQ